MALLLVAITSASASGQACIGMPAVPGQLAVSGSFTTGSSFDTFGAQLDVNPGHRLLAGVSYRVDDRPDPAETGQTLGARAGIELPIPNSSICLVADPTYSTFDVAATTNPPVEAASIRTLRVPVLLSVGQRLEMEGDFYAVPSARGGLVYRRNEVEVEGAAEPDTRTESDVLVGASATIGRGATFASIGLTALTEPQARPRYTILVGFLFP